MVFALTCTVSGGGGGGGGEFIPWTLTEAMGKWKGLLNNRVVVLQARAA